jgi:hypothetical protein
VDILAPGFPAVNRDVVSLLNVLLRVRDCFRSVPEGRTEDVSEEN